MVLEDGISVCPEGFDTHFSAFDKTFGQESGAEVLGNFQEVFTDPYAPSTGADGKL